MSDFSDLSYWMLMVAIVGGVKFVEAYRRPATQGDWMLAGADAATALVVWKLSSSLMIGLWSSARAGGYHIPPVSEDTFMTGGMIVALLGVRQIMAFIMNLNKNATLREAVLLRLAGVSGASVLVTYLISHFTGIAS